MSEQAPAHFARVFPDEGQAPARLVAEYRAGGPRLREVIAGMDGPTLDARPIPGKMSTREVMSHVADSEQFLADRIKRAIATDNPLLVGVNESLYVDALHYGARDVGLQLALVDVTRAQMAADLDPLPEEAWSRTGVHTEVGILTVRQMVLHAIRHLELHVTAIEEKREALGL